MKRVLLILSLICICVFANAQNTLKGKIIDGQTEEALPGANIIIEGTSKGTIAQLDGSFVLKTDNSKFSIIISFVGYLEQKLEVEVSGTEKDLGIIKLIPDAIGLEELLITASFARDRQTPISVTKIEPRFIEEKLSSKEFPEILRTTPSVYATKTGGGYGDGRINLRGFSSENIGVMINGVPVNDMENGKVYWSNWAGLSDVTRTMQVQRGLGASKVALSSVGGTINILTKTTDAEKGGTFYYSIGNDMYKKYSLTLSTGLLDNGWAVTVSGSKTTGDGYVNGTNFEAYSYFLNVSKRINNRHQIALTAFGAPQWHNQRYYMHPINDYRNDADGIKFNSDYGYRNGEIYSLSYNKYHKPQISLNHTWQISRKSILSTAVYASYGRGGGRRSYGSNDSWIKLNSADGKPYAATLVTPEGYINYDAVLDSNKVSATGSKAIMAMATNSHDWYGLLTSFNTKISKLNITTGLDGRYYKGYHNYVIDDLLGGAYFLNGSNKNRPAGEPLYTGDYINYNYIGEVIWTGLFVQGEYVSDQFSAFLSASGANTYYRKTDYFNYLDSDPDQVSDWKDFLTYSVKMGLNYNINSYNNVFINGGYFTKAPFFNSTFKQNSTALVADPKVERIGSVELGYGYRAKSFRADLTAYHTRWLDKTFARTYGDETFNFLGLNALHSGIEAEITIKPLKRLDIKLMGSIANWIWQKDVTYDVYDKNLVYQRTDTLYAQDVHVGDAAQTTASISIDYEILPKLKVGFDFSHFDRLYAQFAVESRTKADKGKDAWILPSYQLLDFNCKYDFKIGKLNSTFYANVDNVLNAEYIADAKDGATHNCESALVYFGFGRTYTFGMRIRF